MLAKLWKKVLLAVCIIACIFNIMSKLVNRHSLRENLESANDGETVFSIFQKDEVVESESEPIIEGVINPEPVVENTIENTSAVTSQTNITTENATTEETIAGNNTVAEEVPPETTEEQPVEEEQKDDGMFKFSDFTILF